MKKDPEFCSFFPSKFPKDKGPSREYFFNILNTLQPEYLGKLMAHAANSRMSAENVNNQTKSIQISEYWADQLKAMPYLSRKSSIPRIFLTLFSYLQRSLEKRSTFSNRARSNPRPRSKEKSSRSSALSRNTRTARRSPSLPPS